MFARRALIHDCIYRYVKTFKKCKEELTARLFACYNDNVFDNQVNKVLHRLCGSRVWYSVICTFTPVSIDTVSRAGYHFL